VVGEARALRTDAGGTYNVTLVGVCAGADHSVLLDAYGRLWSAGYNQEFQIRDDQEFK